jgi:formylglycine-generating enzyme required for sulfatase activity
MNFEPDQMPPHDEAAAAGLSPGRVIAGRFRLDRLLGCGAMGVVWLAWDATANQWVALKFVSPEITGNPSTLEILRREVVRCQQLSHSNIARIYDLIEAEGEVIVSMDYVDGTNLAALRVEQPHGIFRWETLVPAVTQVCQALEYAHSQRMVHCDLKPANLMLDTKGRLKLADLGVSAAVRDALVRRSEADQTADALAYASPQQMNAEPPRASDDLYAFGAVMYELLTGKPPFYAGDILHKARSLHATPIEARLEEFGLVNEVPLYVADTVMACLAKDLAQRPQTIREVAERLGLDIGPEIPMIPEPEAAPSATPGRSLATSNRLTVLFATITIILLVAIGLLLSKRAKENALAQNSGANGVFSPSVTNPPPSLDFELVDLVWIPPGSFVMGSPERDPDRSPDEMPPTEVFIGKGFWLGKFEVTQAEYLKLMSNNPAKFTGDLTRPIESVGWDDAVEYCAKLTAFERKQGRLPAGYVYRLPTEAEWEYAARAGTTTRFSFGNDPAALGDYAWFAENSSQTTHPVGHKKPNPWGLYDTHGNVWEWCLDWKGPYGGARIMDPAGPRTGSFRINRGGSWFDQPKGCRSANRFNPAALQGFEYVGFRVALASPIQQ